MRVLGERCNRSQLQALVSKEQRRSSVEIETTVVRDYPPADAIVRQVLKFAPDLLIVESHRYSKLARALLDQTDWELLRNCPCPLWLSKSGRLPTGRSMKVLAAIDPFHSRAKPARLDDVIMRTALGVAGGKPERIIACHAYEPPNLVMPVAMPALALDVYWQPLSEPCDAASAWISGSASRWTGDGTPAALTVRCACALLPCWRQQRATPDPARTTRQSD